MDLFGVTFSEGKVLIDTNPTKAKQRTVDTVKNDPVPPPA
jgi:hypothetical protein